MADLNYTFDGYFYRLLPNTIGGEYIYNMIVKVQGDGAIAQEHWKSVKSQIKSAGYSLRKSTKVTMSDEDLLAELGL